MFGRSMIGTTVPYLTVDIRFKHLADIKIDWPCIMSWTVLVEQVMPQKRNYPSSLVPLSEFHT